MPHVCEPEALVVAGEDPIAVSRRDQLDRKVEAVIGVFERTLRDSQREPPSSIVGRRHGGARLVEHCTRLLDATRSNEVVEEACEVTGAHTCRKIGEIQGEASGADTDLG